MGQLRTFQVKQIQMLEKIGGGDSDWGGWMK